MLNLYSRTKVSNTADRRSKRRPLGVSRRQKKQYGFETLEDRRVMDGSAPAFDLADFIAGIQATSYSTATSEGLLQTLAREINRYPTATDHTEIIPHSIPSDPYVGDQWHLINSAQQVGNPDYQDIFGVAGEDINVAPAWGEGAFGNGVVVAVVDSGVEMTHPDLAGNIHPTLRLDALELDGDPSPRIFPFDPDNPQLWSGINAHGTSVAGIIAAMANNGEGGTGIAPEAQIVPIRLIDPAAPRTNPDNPFVNTFRYATQEIDITNNSWGPGGTRTLSTTSAAEALAIRDSVFFGRDGNGVIHVFSSGNSASRRLGFNNGFDTSAYNGWVNSRYTIGVTGVDHDGEYNNVDGTVTGYPEISSSVLIAAPTGSNAGQVIATDTGLGSGILATDTTNNSGFNIDALADTNEQFDRDFFENEEYTSRFNGTSAAAPMVSGVIALMLGENPDLNWRDVQEILIRSARQNSEFATQANGVDKAVGVAYQNTWIQNQVPLFHDPDIYDPTIDARTLVLNPTLDPNRSFGSSAIHYAPTPHTLTNGAGYTVSQGRGTDSEATGFAHGVVDAQMAVQLARQWHQKRQDLPDELTFSTVLNTPFANNLPAAELVDAIDASDADLIVPGGLGGGAGFSAYWNEYFADNPFEDTELFPARGLPLELTIPQENTMSIETIEVTVTIDGSVNDALDNVRMVLVSPNGTHSELNHYFIDPSFGDLDFHQIDDPLGSNFFLRSNGLDGATDQSDFLDPSAIAGVPDQGETLQFTFSTNRSWGERSDDALIFDPITKEPIIQDFLLNIPGLELPGIDFTGLGVGGNLFNVFNSSGSDVFSQGWQLYFENYGATDLSVGNVEVAWHGSPIDPATRRIQGLIGVDDNQDDLFNFDRTLLQQINLDGNESVVRLGEVQNLVDVTHESMAGNVTVTATRVSDGVIVDQFVTGADGNYYFDLLPDDYIISVEDPLGRTALDDSLTETGFLKNYQAQWLVSEDFFQVWDYDSELEVPLDENGAPVAFLDGRDLPIEYHVKEINFLLDPGVVPPDQVEFNGVIFADTAGDGVFNGDDVYLPDISVFADINRNGFVDSGEPIAQTGADGSYTLSATTEVASIINVGVLPPLEWTVSNPVGGIDTFFANPGERISDVDFALVPTASNGNGGNTPGIILGTVFDDVNENALRNSTEAGVAGLTVYLDLNNSGVLDAGDRSTITNGNGSYVFTDVSPGSYNVRINAPLPFQQTLPFLGGANIANVSGAGTAYPINFGVKNTAVLDFGDLPALYAATLLGEDGARHSKGAFFLGARIDAELNGQPTTDADGDDLAGVDDEDGIVIGALPSGGGTVGLTATASRHGGFLKAWMDFNNDGDFDDAGERIVFRDPSDPGGPASSNWLLDAGVNSLQFDAPAIGSSVVYARFRYGEFDIDSVTGFAQIGEVEDYAVPVDAPIIVPSAGEPGDFDGNDRVHGSDFLAWQRGYGTTSGATLLNGDGNGDGDVDDNDLAAWEAGFTAGPLAVAAPVTGDYDLNGKTVGADFMAWQRGVGQIDPNLTHGDSNGDDAVDGRDLSVWQGMFGMGVGPTSASAQGIVALSFDAGASSPAVAPRLAALGQRVAAELGNARAVRPEAADAVFAEQLGDQPASVLSDAARLPRAKAVSNDDLFSVSRARARESAVEDAADHDAVFATL